LGLFTSNKKKNNSTAIKASLDIKLERLDRLGIQPKDTDFVEWIYNEWGKDRLESDPYTLLLFSLGGEREVENTWEPLSEDIYSFDTECVEDDDSYKDVLKRLVAITKGELSISNISSTVNHEDSTASLSFIFNGVNYKWNLEYDDDWFDCTVLTKINKLLRGINSTKYFYACQPDQTLTVLFTKKIIVDELNSIVRVPFNLI
jgi:hypothetical protein